MAMEAEQCGYVGWAVWLWWLSNVAMDAGQCGYVG